MGFQALVSKILGLVLAGTALSQPALQVSQSTTKSPALSLKDAIIIALKGHPDLLAATAQTDSAFQKVIQANAAFLPTITPIFGYSYVHQYQHNGITTGFGRSGGGGSSGGGGGGGASIGGGGGGGNGADRVTSNQQQGVVALNWTVIDSGQRAANKDQAQHTFESAKFSLEQERQTIIVNVAEAYYNALQQSALVDVADANVAHTKSALDAVEAEVAAGTVAKKDTYQAQADYANAQVGALQARNNYDVAQAQLKQAMGILSSDQLTLQPAGESPPALESTTFVQYLDQATKNRPDLLAQSKLVASNRAAVRLAKSNAGLSVNLGGTVQSVFSPDHGNGEQLTASVSFPLFDGGLTASEVRQAQDAVKSSEAQLQSLRLQVAVDVETAYKTLQTAAQSIPAAKAAEKAAQVNFDSALLAQKEGAGTILDIINARTLLVQAQSSFVQALYQYYTARVKLEKAIGKADEILTTAK